MKKALVMIGGGYHKFASCGAILAERLKAYGSADCTVNDDRDAFLRLDDYDVVIVYAQGGKLTVAQEQSLCDWVAAGGAFVGIHCASDCFMENERYMEMVGSQFATHGPITEFRVEMADAEHDATRNIEPFTITDEFYILKPRTAKPLHTIMTGSWQHQTQPIGYVREYGKGRMFYTALGHDERAFNHPSFIKLIHRGIFWATRSIKSGPVWVGLVGYGPSFNMGKLHADSIRGAKGFEVIAVCDIDPVRLDVAKEEQPSVKTFDDARKMAASGDVDIAVIITPHDSHVSIALDLLNAGVGVICEKPFSLTRDEATQMIDAARKKNVLLTTFHNRRWDADFLTIRKVIAEGLIGEVFHAEAFFGNYKHPGYWWRSHKPISGGAIYDWGAHITDWILNLMPYKMQTVTGFFSKRVWHDVTNEDHCKVVIRFEGNRTAELEISHLAAVGKHRWRILGTKGGLTSHFEPPVKVTSHIHGLPENIDVPYVTSNRDVHYYQLLADHLLAGEPIPVTPESARRVITVLELAEKSSQSGKAEIVPGED